MIRFIVSRYHPSQHANAFVNVGVIAQDGEQLIAKFCSDRRDLVACNNMNLEIVPLNVGDVFSEVLDNPPTKLDYQTMKRTVIPFGEVEFFNYLKSHSYASHLRYSEIYQFDIPKLSDVVVGTLYDLFVSEQYDNPFSGARWKENVRRNQRTTESHDRVAII